MRLSNQLTLAVLAVVGLQLAGCQKQASKYTKVEPAKVEKVEGSEFSRLTLTEKAMERLGVKTTPVSEGKAEGAESGAARPMIPYSAIMYVPNGNTFVYTSPQPRIFVRQAVNVDYIKGDLAVLKDGPAKGTEVVSVGAAELFGTEFGVGH